MRKLPNGNIEFYYEGGIWSLIRGIVLTLIMVAIYFVIPFQKGQSWIYVFIAAPVAVVCVMLFKNFFKPTAQLIISPEGIESFRYRKLFNSKTKLSWNQIAKISYDKRRETAGRTSYTVELLLCETLKKNDIITCEFAIPFMKIEDRKQLYSILKEHNFIIEELQHEPPTNSIFKENFSFSRDDVK